MSTLTAQVERIQEQLQRLRLIRLAAELPALLQDASKKDLAYSDFLEEVLSREIAAKHERLTTMKTAMARFPFQKSLDSFDFKFQPSIDPKVIKDLATCRFIADTDNVLLLGPPGVSPSSSSSTRSATCLWTAWPPTCSSSSSRAATRRAPS